MFKFLEKKKKDIVVYAPVDGEQISLEELPDRVFSSKMMGDGVAFCFTGNQVCAPCDGKLAMIANTKHAFGMELDNGTELLVHIGMDTVNLNGEGFQVLAEAGKRVKKGTPIIAIDRSFMEEQKVDLTTPLIVVKDNGIHFQICQRKGNVIMGATEVIRF